MICNYLVTITLLMSAPTKHNTQGVIKVKQYRYSEFLRAINYAKNNISLVGLGELDAKYPKITGVQFQRFNKMKCNYDGEEYE